MTRKDGTIKLDDRTCSNEKLLTPEEQLLQMRLATIEQSRVKNAHAAGSGAMGRNDTRLDGSGTGGAPDEVAY